MTGSGDGEGEGEVEGWERRYRAEGRLATRPARFVVDAVRSLHVEPGTAIDVAGGTGRHAVWLAGLGWAVTLVDGSATALAMARQDASAARLAVATVAADLTRDALPAGRWDLVLVHHYLDRGLMRGIDRMTAPGGHLVWAQPTVESPQPRPSARHRLRIGEAVTLLPPGLEVVSLVEGFTEGRHEAMVIARLPA